VEPEDWLHSTQWVTQLSDDARRPADTIVHSLVLICPCTGVNQAPHRRVAVNDWRHPLGFSPPIPYYSALPIAAPMVAVWIAGKMERGRGQTRLMRTKRSATATPLAAIAAAAALAMMTAIKWLFMPQLVSLPSRRKASDDYFHFRPRSFAVNQTTAELRPVLQAAVNEMPLTLRFVFVSC